MRKSLSPYSAVLILSSLLLGSCSYIAVHTAPAKIAAPTRSDQALKADTVFWDTLHGGNYDGIPKALEAVTAAYLQTPEDAITTAHVGWLHIWTLAESARLERVPATITDHAVLARSYFQEAVALNPSDARYLGFLGSAQLAQGAIHHDEKLSRQGYYTLRSAIDAWPEFNLFTAGYVMSGQPADSPRFKEGLAWQWKTLDECAGAVIDRQNPDFSRYMSLATKAGKKRVCWNSWIAPHNFEGFFLNMGDMLVKAGDWQTARSIYANAKLSPDYRSWPFAPVLEERIRNAQANVGGFRDPNGTEAIMLKSKFACMGCHQR
ncbi:MAG TPA: hypothetical protein VFB04_08350 [Terriglobales bacterium]|nr:hypothetical protein [Terriglobales bacterium]